MACSPPLRGSSDGWCCLRQRAACTRRRACCSAWVPAAKHTSPGPCVLTPHVTRAASRAHTHTCATTEKAQGDQSAYPAAQGVRQAQAQRDPAGPAVPKVLRHRVERAPRGEAGGGRGGDGGRGVGAGARVCRDERGAFGGGDCPRSAARPAQRAHRAPGKPPRGHTGRARQREDGVPPGREGRCVWCVWCVVCGVCVCDRACGEHTCARACGTHPGHRTRAEERVRGRGGSCIAQTSARRRGFRSHTRAHGVRTRAQHGPAAQPGPFLARGVLFAPTCRPSSPSCRAGGASRS